MIDAPRPGTLEDLRVDVSEIRRRVGNQREVHRVVPSPELGLSSASVPDATPIEVDVVLEAISDGVTVTGAVHGAWAGECRRCLDEVGGLLELRVREVFSVRPSDDDVLPLEGDHLDLWPVVRDALVLALPLAPLCSDGCAGPDPASFPVSVADELGPTGESEAPEGEDAAPRDPRWAALEGLRLPPGD